MSKQIIAVIIIFIASIGESYTQSLETSSSSFPTDRYYETLQMDNGFFSFSIDSNGYVIHYFFTDENLNVINFGKCDFADYPVRIMKKVKGDKAYIFFNFLSAGNWQKIVMTIDSITGEVLFIPIQNFVMATINDFYVLDNSIAMVGLYKKNLNMIQFLDINKSNQQPYTLNLDMKIYDIAASGGYLDILASNHRNRDGSALELLTYNEQGEKLSTIETETGFEKNEKIKTAVLHKNRDDKFSIAGTYSNSRWSKFSGYFYWNVDASFEQKLNKYPTSILNGFSGNDDKTINRLIRNDIKKGFKVINMLEDNGKLAIVSEPIKDNFERGFIHILKVSKDGEIVQDKSVMFDQFLIQNLKIPPVYMVNGNVYFLNQEINTIKPKIMVHDFQSDEKYGSEKLSNLIPPYAPVYNIIKLKENELVIYGVKEDTLSDENFFMVKFPKF